jgi:type IV pilus assembly protein PilP
MNKTLNMLLKAILVIILASLVSCGDDKSPASQPQVVNKKINMAQPAVKPAAQPNASQGVHEAGAKTQPAMAKLTGVSPAKEPAGGPFKESGPASLSATTGNPAAETPPITSDLIQASLEIASTYDPTGRIDPFEPLFSDEPEAPVVRASTGNKQKRAPQTPLEKVALSQLKLTAIMRMPQGNRALVEDATGKGYVVKKGTYMGLNAGQVIKIDKNSIVVEEEIQNMVGEYIINNTELKLQKTAGEL